MDIFSNFSVDRFLASLQYMWQGMLCIFVVMAVIIASVYVIGYFCTRAEERKKNEEAGE